MLFDSTALTNLYIDKNGATTKIHCKELCKPAHWSTQNKSVAVQVQLPCDLRYDSKHVHIWSDGVDYSCPHQNSVYTIQWKQNVSISQLVSRLSSDILCRSAFFPQNMSEKGCVYVCYIYANSVTRAKFNWASERSHCAICGIDSVVTTTKLLYSFFCPVFKVLNFEVLTLILSVFICSQPTKSKFY